MGKGTLLSPDSFDYCDALATCPKEETLSDGNLPWLLRAWRDRRSLASEDRIDRRAVGALETAYRRIIDL